MAAFLIAADTDPVPWSFGPGKYGGLSMHARNQCYYDTESSSFGFPDDRLTDIQQSRSIENYRSPTSRRQ